MKHLKKLSLQGAKETIDERWLIEMKGIFIVVPFEEIPIQKCNSVRGHPLVKLTQLRRWIRQMLQNIQTDHSVKTHITGAAKIPMHGELVAESHRLGALLNKGLIVRV